ncbi:MAG: N-acetylmuramoyl-L-alanine amidase [Pseudomonadota bacterium]
MISAPSPNFDDRQSPVRLVVLHYTGMETGHAALERMCDPAAKVAAHYMIEQDGRLFQLVTEEKRAWHAGLGGWGDIDDVNDVSIGIELVNRGHYWGYEEFPDEQITSLEGVLQLLFDRYDLTPAAVIGHSDIAPERKDDPGEKFPWARLAKKGFSLPPFTEAKARDVPDHEASLIQLKALGYRFKPTHPAAAVLAFQRRFVPDELGQGLSPRTRAAIQFARAQVSLRAT